MQRSNQLSVVIRIKESRMVREDQCKQRLSLTHLLWNFQHTVLQTLCKLTFLFPENVQEKGWYVWKVNHLVLSICLGCSVLKTLWGILTATN